MAKTILVADVEPAMRELFRESLTTMGYRVIEASNGWEALEKMRTIVPDLVMLDIMMPGLDGIAVVSRLRSDPRFASVPIIALTGSGDRERAMEAGFDDHVMKPATLAELKKVVEHLLSPS